MAILTLKDLHGTPDRPLIVDGDGATIDGEGKLRPLMVDGCSYLWLRNYNFCNSSVDVIHVRKSEYCRFEQLCAWGAASQNVDENSTNYNAFGVHNSHDCHIVDCAFWGTGRKTVSPATNGDDLVWDRCWAEYREPWDEANDIHQGKPRMTWAICYNNVRNTYLDCIGSCTTGTPGKGFYRAVFSVDHQDDGSDPQTRLYRCLALSAPGLVVKPFSNGTQEPGVQPPTGVIPGVHFEDCQDGCTNGHVEPEEVEKLRLRWSTSPILGRIKTLAGVDVLGRLDSLAHPTPVVTPIAPPA